MLDVHPPHESVHSWRDFLIHLVTITIGLFIALSLEGCVEWRHHRHLVHEAESSLRTEIKSNADGMKGVLRDVHDQQEDLRHDLGVLGAYLNTGKLPGQHEMSVSFHLLNFDDVAWRTAQSTGALSYMRYADAQEFASIYTLQEETNRTQQQAVRDAILSVAPLASSDPGDAAFQSREQAETVRSHIEILQGQLLLLDSLLQAQNAQYQKYLSAHP